MSKNKKAKKDKKSAKGTKRLATLAKNPLVADVVAAALVATAAALKDPRRARALASDAGDELHKLSKEGLKAGNAFWDMALQIGRRSLDSLVGDEPKEKKKSKPAGKSGKAKLTAAAAPAKSGRR